MDGNWPCTLPNCPFESLLQTTQGALKVGGFSKLKAFSLLNTTDLEMVGGFNEMAAITCAKDSGGELANPRDSTVIEGMSLTIELFSFVFQISRLPPSATSALYVDSKKCSTGIYFILPPTTTMCAREAIATLANGTYWMPSLERTNKEL